MGKLGRLLGKRNHERKTEGPNQQKNREAPGCGFLHMKMRTQEWRNNLITPEKSSETQSSEFPPSLFRSTNITFRRNDPRNIHQHPLKLTSQFQVEPVSYFIKPTDCSEVTFKKLPFYQVLNELVRPSNLQPDNSTSGKVKNTFQFYLTPQQIEDIRTSQIHHSEGYTIDHVIQVQMRFCLQEEEREQEDCIPPGVTARVNGQSCQIPYHSRPVPGDIKTKKQFMKPVDITSFVKLSVENNQVQIICPPDFGKKYVVGIFLVRKLSSYELMNQMRINNVKDADVTRTWIVDKLNEDASSEIATTSLRVSLACPLGKMRMSAPCRASTCTHLQCFDAILYLQMNELRPTWKCPVCNKYAPHDSLVIDEYFKEVLASGNLVEDENEIQLLPDGSWEISITGHQDHDGKSQDTLGSSSKIVDAGGLAGCSEEPKTDDEKKRIFLSISSDDEERNKIKALPFKKRKLDCFEKQVVVLNLD